MKLIIFVVSVVMSLFLFLMLITFKNIFDQSQQWSILLVFLKTRFCHVDLLYSVCFIILLISALVFIISFFCILWVYFTVTMSSSKMIDHLIFALPSLNCLTFPNLFFKSISLPVIMIYVHTASFYF